MKTGDCVCAGTNWLKWVVLPPRRPEERLTLDWSAPYSEVCITISSARRDAWTTKVANTRAALSSQWSPTAWLQVGRLADAILTMRRAQPAVVIRFALETAQAVRAPGPGRASAFEGEPAPAGGHTGRWSSPGRSSRASRRGCVEEGRCAAAPVRIPRRALDDRRVVPCLILGRADDQFFCARVSVAFHHGNGATPLAQGSRSGGTSSSSSPANSRRACLQTSAA
jgi:hypothetical protein